MKFTVRKLKSGWHWNLRAKNGEIIASGEGYRRKIDCIAAVRMVQRSGEASVTIIKARQ